MRKQGLPDPLGGGKGFSTTGPIGWGLEESWNEETGVMTTASIRPRARSLVSQLLGKEMEEESRNRSLGRNAGGSPSEQGGAADQLQIARPRRRLRGTRPAHWSNQGGASPLVRALELTSVGVVAEKAPWVWSPVPPVAPEVFGEHQLAGLAHVVCALGRAECLSYIQTFNPRDSTGV